MKTILDREFKERIKDADLEQKRLNAKYREWARAYKTGNMGTAAKLSAERRALEREAVNACREADNFLSGVRALWQELDPTIIVVKGLIPIKNQAGKQRQGANQAPTKQEGQPQPAQAQ